VREEAAYPDIAGAAAVDGTGSHLLLELCLLRGVSAQSFVGEIIGVNHEDQRAGWMVNIDRAERVQVALDYIGRRVAELQLAYPDCAIKVQAETQSNPGEKYGRDDWWGTVDVTITAVEFDDTINFIEVCDYKDGRTCVDASGNSQLVSYLAGKLPDYDVGCRMSIVQPKTEPKVRWSSVNHSSVVMREADKLFVAAVATDNPDAPLIPGKHCEDFCKHKANCTAGSKKAIAAVPQGSLFESITSTFGDVTLLDDKKLTELADARAGLESVFDKVEAEIQRRIEAGQHVSGYAMRPGRSSNAWNVPEEEVVKMLKGRKLKLDDIYPSKLISPAQVLKLGALTNEQKDKISKQYISNVAGALKLTKVVNVFEDLITFL
jgi:hypothetical protein